jgi:pSer/pThr/pTyr-binding forkhead associated (FHA) protein
MVEAWYSTVCSHDFEISSAPVDIKTSPKLIIRRILGSVVTKLENASTWTIGRDEVCDIVLQDTWVSRKHASIHYTDAGDFFFEDLGSANGSAINGEPVQSPTRLNHGDLIVVGTTEMEFHNLEVESDDVVLASPQASTKGEILPTVLITQMHPPQRDIWDALLTTQGLSVQVEPSYPDLHEYLINYHASGQRLPSLLLFDIETYPSNAYSFCRWCKHEFPDLKIVLISGTRTEIFPVERQWAIYQGAHDLMPGIQEPNLMAGALDTVAKIEQIFKALNLRPNPQQSIMTTLINLQKQLSDGVGLSSNH